MKLRILLLAALSGSALLADQAAAFFDDSKVREIRLNFESANWYNTLLQAHNTAADPYFPCRFRSEGIEIPVVGCRFKGNSSFRRNGIKKPFKIDFNEFSPNATFLGLTKLNINNFDLAPDFMREKLLHDFAGKYVGALRSVYVRLYVNDVFYGLYLAVEQPDKAMMRARYGDNEDGNLYEAEEGGASRPNLSWLGSNQSAYENVYILKTNEDKNDFSGLIRFLDILNNTPTAELPGRLETIAEVENWLYGMAINNLFVNLDSYLGAGAEYYLYHRDSDGRFVHIQWDHNESFGITGDGTPRLANPYITDPFYLPTAGGGGGPGGGGGAAANARPLLEKLWAVPEYRRLYLRLMAKMVRENFQVDAYAARVTQLADLIRADVIADPNKAYSTQDFETALNAQVGGGNLVIPGINQFVRERYAYLRPRLNELADASDVRLNEIVTVNTGAFRDEAGDADPWVEIFNLGPGPVTLTGFALSDDAANPGKWTIPTRTLADGESLIVWLDGETAEGPLHAPFQARAGGGTLVLTAGSNTDTVTYPAVASGQSYARAGYYGARWVASAPPTPNRDNAASAAAPTPATGTGQLLINELMADNNTTYPDPDEAGAFEDWFEVYNPSAAAVDMSGMYITDSLTNRTKWQVPAGVTIPAGGRLVFMADGETAQGPRHTSWSLSAEGESISIYQSDGTTLIDTITFSVQNADISFGRTTDGASTWSIFQPATPGAANARPFANWVTNAASFVLGASAPGSIASAFGSGLAAAVQGASSTTLPNTLGGVTVAITDSAGASHTAPLFFVSPSQVNFLVPTGAAAGRGRLSVRRDSTTLLDGDMLIATVGPALFSANANGQGIGLMAATRVVNGAQSQVTVFRYDTGSQRTVAVPVSLAEGEVYLTLYGTGIGNASAISQVEVEIDGDAVPVTFAGAQPEFPGLDQINIGPLPRSLAGQGDVDILIQVDGKRGNAVTINFQ